MKIGIISDTHGHEMAWANACERFFKGADLILHAGDVLYHGPRNPMKADYNPAGLVARINMPIEAPYAYVVWEGLRIIVTHGDAVMSAAEKDAMAKHLEADLFISGHIHQTVLEKRGATVFLNPGSAALSKRADGRNTVAVLENGTIRIFDIDTGDVLHELAL